MSEPAATSTPDPTAIMDLGTAFMPSRVLLTAVELGLFTELGATSRAGAEIAERLGLARSRGLYDFLDGLVATGMIERDGAGPDARYRNSENSRVFLDAASPRYLGGFLRLTAERFYSDWSGLTEALRTGSGLERGDDHFGDMYSDPAQLRRFMQAMAGASANVVVALAEKVDFSGYSQVTDIGGATGQLSVALARRHPHLTCTSFDLPAVEPIAAATIRAAGLDDRVNTMSGDFFADPLPPSDALIMSQVLHDWDLDQKRQLIRAAHRALRPGGALIAVESLIDDERRQNVYGLMLSLHMLIETSVGFDYTGAEFHGWCTEAGFRDTEVISLAGPAYAAIAYR